MTSDPSISLSDALAPEPGSPARTVAIHTHGCKLNQSDSQTLARQFGDAGYRVVGPTDAADVVVLNTCTVTATADAKARQFLRAARRRNPDAVVVATGCYAQRAPAALEKLPEVSLVIGNTGKTLLVDSVDAALETQIPSWDFPAPSSNPPTPSLPRKRESGRPTGGRPHPNPLPEGGGTSGVGRTRAMVKIQEGCDQVCAYCIVPKVRGRERSIAPEAIIAEINRHVSEGCREVALTGTQLGTYGFDIPGESLPGLLERILAETSVERLRVSSLQAHEITAALLELWEAPRLMPHFHVPLQSGSNAVLKSMRRRYDTAQFAASVELIRERYPDAGITTDIIVGFPGETAQDFEVGLDFAAGMRFSDIHAFPYSQRPGTSAVYFKDQVADGEKRERMGEMLALSAESRTRFREGQIGNVRQVLWERSSSSSRTWSGLTDNYLRVRTVHDLPLSNRITGARLVGLNGDHVEAQVLY